MVGYEKEEVIRMLNNKDWELIRDLQNLEKKLIDLTEQVHYKIDKIKRRTNI